MKLRFCACVFMVPWRRAAKGGWKYYLSSAICVWVWFRHTRACSLRGVMRVYSTYMSRLPQDNWSQRGDILAAACDVFVSLFSPLFCLIPVCQDETSQFMYFIHPSQLSLSVSVAVTTTSMTLNTSLFMTRREFIVYQGWRMKRCQSCAMLWSWCSCGGKGIKKDCGAIPVRHEQDLTGCLSFRGSFKWTNVTAASFFLRHIYIYVTKYSVILLVDLTEPVRDWAGVYTVDLLMLIIQPDAGRLLATTKSCLVSTMRGKLRWGKQADGIKEG